MVDIVLKSPLLAGFFCLVTMACVAIVTVVSKTHSACESIGGNNASIRLDR